jgi:GNAT superfamily N-acetyltransferase
MVECFEANLHDETMARATVELLDAYASDFFGGNEPLSDYSRANLICELRKLPTAHVFLAKDERKTDKYVGLAICFEGFSTFACKPLINVHDFYVRPEFRRQGISSNLIFTIGMG